MASKRRERRRRPARGGREKAPRRLILVVTEGAVTEYEYVTAYHRLVRTGAVEVKVSHKHSDPSKLVRFALDMRDKALKQSRKEGDVYLRYDEVWCVFDRDEHVGFREACALAEGSGLQVATSNPCFELWLLLHFRPSPGHQERHRVVELLKTHLPGYDKHLSFEALIPGIPQARAEAERIAEEARREGDPRGNPSTEVHRLLAAIAPPPRA